MEVDDDVTILNEGEFSNPSQKGQSASEEAISSPAELLETPKDDEPIPVDDTEKVSENDEDQSTVTRGRDAVLSKKTKTDKREKGNELDKFKRRLIRTIARLMLKEKQPYDHIWDELKKQTGCDCELLWQRMRTLTIKKLRRLFVAQDKIENITKIAQLSVTDWLLYDLVLVHEKVDVIGQELPIDSHVANKILERLFKIVVEFRLEFLKGDDLTKAWFEATKLYNGRVRQCSPMLLQRRWYQMKETVREKFYQFWFTYRGDSRRLLAANQFKPTELEMDIIRAYKSIATEPFPTWEKLIELKKVALPEDFERLQLAKRKIFRNENEPDLEVIEQHIETIDIEDDSNSEESRDSVSTHESNEDNTKQENSIKTEDNIKNTTHLKIGIIKTETIDNISDEDDISALESMHIPLENPNTDYTSESKVDTVKETNRVEDQVSIANDNNEQSSEELEVNLGKIKEKNDTTIVNIDQTVDNSPPLIPVRPPKPPESIATISEPQNTIGDIENQCSNAEVMLPKIVASSTLSMNLHDFETVMPKITSVTSTAMQLEEAAENSTTNKEVDNILESVYENIKDKSWEVPLLTASAASNISGRTDIVGRNVEQQVKIEKRDIDTSNVESFTEIPSDLNLFDGIELEDDGIEYVEEEERKEIISSAEVKTETPDDDEDNTPKIDLKLLLTPVVYTKKLDHMDVFRFIDYDAVQDKRVIENAAGESKPVDKNSVKMEEISQERSPSPESDVCSESECEDQSKAEFTYETVSRSSWLLNKPRRLSYNPIKLCKNPDFNTRLKRLTAGFFSSERNRELLNQCKPLTIDLHKAFEQKLVNQTLYLQRTEVKINENIYVANRLDVTTLPEEKLIPSDVNDSIVTISPVVNQNSNETYPIERNKIINLPDIAEVRRLNERLLTAEVSPIQVASLPKLTININDENRSVDMVPQRNKLLGNTTNLNEGNIKYKEIDSMDDTKNSYEKKSLITCNLETNTSIGTASSKDPHINADIQKKNVLSNTLTTTTENINIDHYPKSKLLREPKKYVRQFIPLPWNKRPPTKKIIIPEDRLLASDTIDKILNVCRGEPPLHPKMYKKMKRKMQTSQKNIGRNTKKARAYIKISDETDISVTKEKKANRLLRKEGIYKRINNVDVVTVDVKKTKSLTNTEKVNNLNKKDSEFCCWARERIASFETKRKCSPHFCTQPVCLCCCRQELVDNMLRKPLREGVEHKTNSIYQSQKSKDVEINKFIEKPTKVSIGVNTDFDKEFEEGYAASLSTGNFITNTTGTNSTPYSAKIRTGINSSVSHETQTYVSNLAEPIHKIYEKTPSINLEISAGRLGPIVSTIPNDLPSVVPNISKQIKKTSYERPTVNKATLKCRTIIKPAEPYKSARQLSPRKIAPFIPTVIQPISHNIQNSQEKVSKVVMLSENIKHKVSSSPICLGKNKILLCSFKTQHEKNVFENIKNNKINQSSNQIELNDPTFSDNNRNNQNAQRQLHLPEGVRLILLPNQELTLSINPDVELDAEQLENLSAIMTSVQQQIAASNIANNMPTSADTNSNTVIQLSDDDTASDFINSNELQTTDNCYTAEITNTQTTDLNTETLQVPTNTLETLDENNITTLNVDHTEVIINDEEIIDQDVMNEKLDLSCSETLTSEITLTNEERIHDKDHDEEEGRIKSSEANVLDNNNSINETGLLDTCNSQKKTILSDLMEMSGISAEDTSVATESPDKQQLEISEAPTIQIKSVNQLNEKVVNNSIHNNLVVSAALSRCPELNILSSYEELRYASENDAQFYKMDIETGIILPVNVCIRKTTKKTLLMTDGVIDLTDEPEEDNTNQKMVKFGINNQLQKAKEGVKPVKLFSSIHPSILRREGKSLLVRSLPRNQIRSSIYKGKKIIRILPIDRKRKQLLEDVVTIDLDTVNEQREEIIAIDENIKNKTETTKYENDSDSDDEPLATKAKRIRSTETEAQLENKDTSEIIAEKSVGEIPSVKHSTLEQTPDEVYINTTHRLEPVVFEPITFGDAGDSSDEDCILGV